MKKLKQSKSTYLKSSSSIIYYETQSYININLSVFWTKLTSSFQNFGKGNEHVENGAKVMSNVEKQCKHCLTSAPALMVMMGISWS